MEHLIAEGIQVTSKVEIGDAPIGTLFTVRTYGQSGNIFHYCVDSTNKIEGNTFRFLDQFLTAAEMYADFLSMFDPM